MWVAKAEQAAAAIGGFALSPTFPTDDVGSDCTDLNRAQATDITHEQRAVAMAIAERTSPERTEGGFVKRRPLDRPQPARPRCRLDAPVTLPAGAGVYSKAAWPRAGSGSAIVRRANRR